MSQFSSIIGNAAGAVGWAAATESGALATAATFGQWDAAKDFTADATRGTYDSISILEFIFSIILYINLFIFIFFNLIFLNIFLYLFWYLNYIILNFF